MGFEIENGILKKYTEIPGVTEVVIPNTVTQIGGRAFSNCCSLEVTIPKSVKKIGPCAFQGCKKRIKP